MSLLSRLRRSSVALMVLLRTSWVRLVRSRTRLFL
nr:MAG TPA: hypothetical protein [Caudoviricetes sp.]